MYFSYTAISLVVCYIYAVSCRIFFLSLLLLLLLLVIVTVVEGL